MLDCRRSSRFKRRKVCFISIGAIAVLALVGLLFLRSNYVLNQIRLALEDQLEKHVYHPVLFSLEPKYQSALGEGPVSPRLREQFEAHGLQLSPAATVSTDPSDDRWHIVDGSKRYVASRAYGGYGAKESRETATLRGGSTVFEFSSPKVLDVYQKRVSVHQITGNVFTGLKVERLEIADVGTNAAPVLSIEHILVRYRLLELLRGKLVVTQVEVRRPQLNAEIDPEGTLNLTQVLAKKTSSSGIVLPFEPRIGQLNLRHGAVNFTDRRHNVRVAIAGLYSQSRGLRAESGWIHVGNLEVRSGLFELNGVETPINALKTEFELHQTQSAWALLRFAFGNSYVVISGDGRVPTASGTVNVRASLDLGELQTSLRLPQHAIGVVNIEIDASGNASLFGGRLAVKSPSMACHGAQLEDFSAEAHFTQDSLWSTHIRGSLASGSFMGGVEAETTGLNDDDLQGIKYGGWLRFVSLQADELLPLPERLKAEGAIGGNAQFGGFGMHPKDFWLEGALKFTEARLNGIPLQTSEAKYRVHQGVVSFTGNLDEAQIAIEGSCGLTDAYALQVDITRIDMGKLSRILNVPNLGGEATLTATSQADFGMQGSKGAGERGSGGAGERGSEGAGERGSGGASRRVGEWTSTHTPASPSTRLPLLAGQLRIPEATLFDVPIGVLTADFDYADGMVSLHPVKLLKADSELTIEGLAHLEGEIPVMLVATAQPFQIAEYIRLTGQDYPIAGAANGKLTLNGTLGHLDGHGELRITEASAWELALDPLTLPIKIEDYTVKINGFNLSAREQRGALDAQIDTHLDYWFDFKSESMELAQLALARGLPDFPLDGKLCVTATGEGNANAPVAALTVALSNLSYNQEAITDIQATGHFENGVLNFSGDSFGGACRITGDVTTEARNPYRIAFQGENVDITPILGVLDSLPSSIVSGEAGGDVRIRGTLGNLAVFDLKGNLSALALHTTTQTLINREPVAFRLTPTALTFERLALGDPRDEEPLFALTGLHMSLDKSEPEPVASAARQTEVSFVMKSDGFKLEYLAELLGLPAIATGTGRYTLHCSGTVERPVLALDWGIPQMQLHVSGYALPIADAHGRATYADGVLVLEEGDFPVCGNRVKVDGRVVVEQRELDLNVSASQFELEKLTSQFPQLPALEGQLNLSANIAGTPEQPAFDARIHLERGGYRGRGWGFGVGGSGSGLRTPAPGVWGSESGKDRSFAGPRTPDPGPRTPDLALDAHLVGDSERVELRVDSARWTLDGGRYSAVGAVRTRGISLADATLPNLADMIQEAVYQLRLNAENVNLVRLVERTFGRDLVGIEGHTDLALDARGIGDDINQLKASVLCDGFTAAVDGQQARNQTPIRFDMAGGVLAIRSLQLGGTTPWLDISGNLDTDGNMDVKVVLEQFPFAALFPAVTLTLFNRSVKALGHLSSTVNLQGNLAHPVIEAKWVADGRFGDAALRDIGNASYKDEVLRIWDTRLIAGGENRLQLSGRIPINLTLHPPPREGRFLDAPLDVRLVGEQVNLNALSSLFPSFVTASSGSADIDMRLQGTTASPHPQGTLTIQRGELKLVGLDAPISAGAMELKASRGELHIPSVTFRIEGGQYEAAIVAKLNGLIPTHLEIRKLRTTKARIADFFPRFAEKSPFKVRVDAEASLDIPMPDFGFRIEKQGLGIRGWGLGREARQRRTAESGSPSLTPNPWPLTPVFSVDPRRQVTGKLVILNIRLDGLGYTLRNRGPIEMSFADAMLDMGQGFVLEGEEALGEGEQHAQLTGYGSWRFGDSIRFRADVKHLELDRLSRYLPEAFPIRGKLNASLDVTGTDSEPQIAFAWETSGGRVADASVDRFAGEITYADGRLRLGSPRRSIRLAVGENHARLSGLIPFHVSLMGFNVRPLPEPLEARLDVSFERFDFLPLILPQIAFAGGKGGVNITVGGALKALELKGAATFEGLEAELPDAGIKVVDTKIDLDFTHEGIAIRAFEGRLNGGRYRIDGGVQSDWFDVRALNLAAELTEGATFEHPGLLMLRCRRADVRMKGAVTVTDTGLTLPPVEGTIRLDEAVYEQHWQKLVKDWFSQEADVQFEVWFDYPVLRELRLALDIIASNNVWIKSDFGNIEIETAVSGKLLGPVQKPVFHGRVDLLDGEFSLVAIDYPFTIRRDAVSYIENTSPLVFNPWYEVNAETIEPIRNVELLTVDGETRTRDVNVKAHLTGFLNEQHRPRLEAEVLRKEAGETYEFTQGQLISILTLGTVDPFADGTTVVDAPSELMLRQSERYLGSQLAKVTGLTETRLDLSPDDFEKSRFIITKELFKRLELSYSSTFRLHSEPRIEVEYEISRYFAIKGERNEQGKYGIDLKVERRF